MLAVVTPSEMRAIDEASPESEQVLIDRAGAAVARAAFDMLGGSYGRRVTVIAGKGNNGADGRAAAQRLEQRGVRVRVLDAALAGGVCLDRCDLVIDAAYGTGFRGEWSAPNVSDAPVLAVDIPSGVDGMTGEVKGDVLSAERTVTFAALKPGLLFDRGAEVVGQIEVADIGLDVSGVRTHLLQDEDVVAGLPRRERSAHKWVSAVWVIAGSPGMTGAALLATRGAQRGGAGYVRLSIPSDTTSPVCVTEAVGFDLSGPAWQDKVLGGLDRFSSLVVGPGIGRDPNTLECVRQLVAKCRLPMVVDGDGLAALGDDRSGVARLRGKVQPHAVLTPHDGEYAALAGEVVGPDRILAARTLAGDAGCNVVLKGPTTVVADAKGSAMLVNSGDSRLATAGSGDVLSGLIGALMARGMAPLEASAFGAHLHGRATRFAPREGMVAGDLPEFLAAAAHAMLEG